MAWLTNWQYRKSHIINAQAGAGTNYQVGIKVYYGSGTDGTETVDNDVMGKVYCNSHCKTDFGDIRFTDDDGSTLLDCWMEEKVNSNYAIFWVEVADSLESSNVTIYIYYGNSNAKYPFQGAGYDYFVSNGRSQPIQGIQVYPSAYYYEGTYKRTYIVYGGAVGTGFNIYITYYDHEYLQFSRPELVGPAAAVDDHSGPAVIVTNDGYIHIFSAQHDRDIDMKYYKSNSPENISAFTAQTTPVPKGTYGAGYPHPVKAANGDIYLFYNMNPNAVVQTYIAFKKSTDNCANWSEEQKIIDCGSMDGLNYGWYQGGTELFSNKIYMVLNTVCNAENYPWRHVLFCYLNLTDLHVYSIDGDDLGTTATFAEMWANCVVLDTEDSGWMNACPSMRLDANGIPHILYCFGASCTDPECTSYIHYHTYWNGSAWTTPVSIGATADYLRAYGDFIVNNATSIEAYICTDGDPGRGGDIDKYAWNGSTWSYIGTVYAENGYALDNLQIPFNQHAPIRMIFCEIKVGDYSTPLKMYAWNGTSIEKFNDDLAHGEATFLLFDNFEDGSFDTNKWSNQSVSSLVEDNGKLRVTYGTAYAGVRSLNTVDLSTGKCVKIKSAWASTYNNGQHGWMFSQVGGATTWYGYPHLQVQLYNASAANKWTFTHWHTAYEYTLQETGTGDTGWHKSSIKIKQGSQGICYHDEFGPWTTPSNVVSTTWYLWIAKIYSQVSGDIMDVDWVFMRKWVSPEPVHSSWGSQERLISLFEIMTLLDQCESYLFRLLIELFETTNLQELISSKEISRMISEPFILFDDISEIVKVLFKEERTYFEDRTYKTIQILNSEDLILNEQILYHLRKIIVQLLNFLDESNFLKIYSRIFLEIFKINDSFLKTVQVLKSENIILIDQLSFTRIIRLILVEILALIPLFRRKITLSKQEILILTTKSVKLLEIIRDQTFQVIDKVNITRISSMILYEILSLVESLSRFSLKVLKDSLEIRDEISPRLLLVIQVLYETLQLIDQISSRLSRTLHELISLKVIISTEHSFSILLKEVLFLYPSIIKNWIPRIRKVIKLIYKRLTNIKREGEG